MSTSASVVPTPSNRKERPAWVRQWFNQETAVAWLFLLPSLIGFITFYAVPAVRGVAISFTDWDLLTEPNNIGFENYRTLIQDEDFWNALRVTTAYVLWNIPIQTFIAVIIAVMMDRVTNQQSCAVFCCCPG